MRHAILSVTLCGAAAVAGFELDRRQSGQNIPLAPDFEFLLGIVGGIGGTSSSTGISTIVSPSTSLASTLPSSSSLSTLFGNSTSQTSSTSGASSSTSLSTTPSTSSSPSSTSVPFSSGTASTSSPSSTSQSSSSQSSSSQSSSSQSSSSQSSSSQSSSSQSSSSSSSHSSSSMDVSSTSSHSSSSSSSSSSLISSSSTVTTTSSFTSSSSSSSTSPAFTGCNFNVRPAVRLPEPTPLVFNNNDNGYSTINSDFPIGVYGTSDYIIYVHVNGLISIFGTTIDNTARAVPNTAGNLPPISMLAYNTDLSIPDTAEWGVYYEKRQSTRFSGRELVVEYIVSSNGADYIHFSYTFYENSIGRTRFEYYQSRLKGADASVGIQNVQISPQRSAQWSFQGAFTQDNFFVEYNAPTSAGDSLSTGLVANPPTSC